MQLDCSGCRGHPCHVALVASMIRRILAQASSRWAYSSVAKAVLLDREGQHIKMVQFLIKKIVSAEGLPGSQAVSGQLYSSVWRAFHWSGRKYLHHEPRYQLDPTPEQHTHAHHSMVLNHSCRGFHSISCASPVAVDRGSAHSTSLRRKMPHTRFASCTTHVLNRQSAADNFQISVNKQFDHGIPVHKYPR